MSSANSWDAPAPTDSRSTGRGPAKGLADYLKGMRRRLWLILLVSAVVGGAGTAYTLKQAPIFWASSRILIEPPRAIVEGIDQQHASNDAAALNFFNTRVQMVTSRRIAERVLNSLQLKNWEELNGVQDPVGELLGWIEVKPVKNSNLVDVGLEGSDSKLVAKIVNSVVEEFLRHEQESLREFDQLSRSRIETELRGLEGMVQGSRQAIADFHKQHENFLMNGDSVEAGRLVILEEAKQQAELRLDAARRAVDQFDALRKAGVPFVHETNQKAMTSLQEEIRRIDDELQYQKEVIRPDRYDTDVAIRRLREKREELMRSSSGYGDAEFEMIRLKQEVQFAQADHAHLVEIADKQRKIVLSQQDEHHQLNTLRGEHERLSTTTDFIAKKRLEAEMHHGLVAPRIQVIDRAEEPREPIRPIKIIQIPLCIIGGVVLGCLSAVALEFMDASIREPEQAIESLEWPLLGVIPKLPRRAIMSHGRPVLAAQMPGTIFCEAFRNLRTGVLGAEGEQELRSVLVTSAKAGEGKTLVAANLAAACARAGESVILVDVDLRNPGLGRYFDIAPSNLGLAEVLEGNIPWQKVLLQTDVDNLTVIPAGDADGVSIDILGTVEMHDLLGELVQKFDRVILDGSPCLGLADGRVVGRFSDGVLFVVQSGSHDCRPLRRVKQLFEHEGLRAAGVVFNGLREQHDDLATQRRPAAATPQTYRRRRVAQSA